MNRESAPGKGKRDTSGKIINAFAKQGCTVIKKGSHSWAASRKKATSTVLGIPPINLMGLLRSRRLRARKMFGSVQAGASIVRIDGPAYDVDSHYHISHLVGLIVRGSGWLNVPSGKGFILTQRRGRWAEIEARPGGRGKSPGLGKKAHEDVGVPVAEGDVIVLPRGAYHVFRCARGNHMEYIALEFSDYQTDYQAHH